MFRIAVLASGQGSNLAAIVKSFDSDDRIEVSAVASNLQSAHALDVARESGIEARAFDCEAFENREVRDEAMAAWLLERSTDLVVLAGYMELVSSKFLSQFPDRVINIHPSLLPAFQGLNAVHRQLDYGVKVGGVTVHFVDDGIDSGPIILQESLEFPESPDLGQVMELIHGVEHRLLPQAIRLIAFGQIEFDTENVRHVRILARTGVSIN